MNERHDFVLRKKFSWLGLYLYQTMYLITLFVWMRPNRLMLDPVWGENPERESRLLSGCGTS